MGRQDPIIYALNRGIISRLGLARGDIKRIAMAAQMQTNWMPRVLGAMMLRVGWKYLNATNSNLTARYLKFIFSTTDTAILELTANTMRVLISDVLLTRPAVTTAITNGTFAANINNWTDLDDAGGLSQWVAPNYMQLVGDGTSRAIREQQVTNLNPGIEHGIRIIIARGPVMLRIGSTSGDDNYVKETVLNTGTHSLSIVPTGDFYIRFFSTLTQVVWVSNCTIEAAGVVTITTPWGASDLNNVRADQSGDILFCASSGLQQRRIERRGTRPNARSWSVALYAPIDGPFQVENTGPIQLTPTGLFGNIIVNASIPYFKSTHVGSLFSITSGGQRVSTVSAVSGTTTKSIRVTGIGGSRSFVIVVSASTLSTVDLQRSYDDVSGWVNVPGESWIGNIATNYADGLDNQIVYYRLILTTRVAPEVVSMGLNFAGGSIRGIFRVTDYSTSIQVLAEVVVDLGGITASSIWQEGSWSDKNGWPTSVKIHEGRLWWSGVDGVFGSISDAYDSFDETFVGDAGPINRTIGSGPVDTINWLLSLKGLLVGAQGSELTARASTLDEILTPTNFNMKVSSNKGSGNVDAIKIDQSGYFVGRNGVKVFNIAFDLKSYDYNSTDLTMLVPEIGLPEIVRMDCQMYPDVRLHCVRSDGTVAVAVMDKSEDMLAWIPIETNGFVEDVVILPAITGNLDDQVYYVVRRTINGSTVRYLEKWAQESECRGDLQYCYLADSYVAYSGPATSSISAPNLAGEEVVVWADGQDIGTDDSVVPWVQRYTADSSGLITLDANYSNIVVGLAYTSQFQSTKLGSNAQGSGALNAQKRIKHIGLVLADTHPKGLQYGSSFDYLDDMPMSEDGTDVGTSTITDYDQNLIEFPGTWTTDSRVCLQGQAPRPVTVLGVSLIMDVNQ